MTKDFSDGQYAKAFVTVMSVVFAHAKVLGSRFAKLHEADSLTEGEKNQALDLIKIITPGGGSSDSSSPSEHGDSQQGEGAEAEQATPPAAASRALEKRPSDISLDSCGMPKFDEDDAASEEAAAAPPLPRQKGSNL